MEDWIRRYVTPSGPIETAHVRPWSTVLRVPVPDGCVYFKACAPVQDFEPRLSARLSARWPDRVAEVLGYDVDRAWLLLADAGTPLIELGNPPQAWLSVLPSYAELQRGEAAYATDHLTHGVPDLRPAVLPQRYDDLLRHPLPLRDNEIERLRRYRPRFAEECAELAAHGIPDSIQHDDLHHANVYRRDGRLRVLDWGDSCVGHPFASLVVTFRFLEERNGLPPHDPWYARLRDAYLEPWGGDRRETFTLAYRVGALAHAIAWARQRDALPEAEHPGHDRWWAVVLRRALALI